MNELQTLLKYTTDCEKKYKRKAAGRLDQDKPRLQAMIDGRLSQGFELEDLKFAILGIFLDDTILAKGWLDLRWLFRDANRVIEYQQIGRARDNLDRLEAERQQAKRPEKTDSQKLMDELNAEAAAAPTAEEWRDYLEQPEIPRYKRCIGS